MGLAAWIDQQLHPSSIDDHAAEALLPPLGTLARRLADPTGAADVRATARSQTLAADKILRAMYSERQLEEVLVDFWFNHFNVYAGKGRTAEYLPDYERDVIRPHVFDHFRDLLEADAKSPAMLFYLDNWLSADPNAAERIGRRGSRRRSSAISDGSPAGLFGGVPAAAAAEQPNANANNGKKKARGLNENYGRELLELHTLGVDGGYTQKDVIEVARAFTGWTIDRDGAVPLRPGAARRRREDRPRPHDQGAAAASTTASRCSTSSRRIPSTAHHIAYRARAAARRPTSRRRRSSIARRRASRETERRPARSRADDRHVAGVLSRRDAQDAKFKTPLEFVVSAVRDDGRDASATRGRSCRRCSSSASRSTCASRRPATTTRRMRGSRPAALVTRMNFATRLASGNMPGVTLPPDAARPANELALRLGSPEFQRR